MLLARADHPVLKLQVPPRVTCLASMIFRGHPEIANFRRAQNRDSLS